MGLTGMKEELAIKKAGFGLYRTSRWLSLIAVPWFAIRLFDLYRPSFSDYVAAAFLPGVPLLFILVLNASDRRLFVKFHAYQALILLAVRMISAFFVAVIAYEIDEGLAVLIFLAVNGSLWWFGNQFGIDQVRLGRNSLMKRSGIVIQPELSDRDIKILEEDIAEYQKLSRRARKREAALVSQVPENRLDLVEEAKRNLAVGAQTMGVSLLEEAFRDGDAETREAAYRELEALGLVALF